MSCRPTYKGVRYNSLEELYEANGVNEQQKQQAQILYSQYLDTIFPNSKVKDIVYHGTNATFEKFMKMYNNIHFGTLKAAKERLKTIKEIRKSTTENIYPVLLNIEKPIITDADFDWELDSAGEQPDPYELIKTVGYLDNWLYENGYLPKEESDMFGLPDKSIPERVALWKNHDSYIYINFVEDKGSKSYSVFEPEQIHILESKQDIQGFKEFVNKSNNTQYQLPQGREQEEYVASEKTIRDLAARMSDRIGIPVRFESDRTKQYKGKLENNTAVINLTYATLDTPIHEILGHPIIRTIKNGVPFTNLKYEIKENSEDYTKQGYPKYYVESYSDVNLGDINFFETKEEAEQYINNLKSIGKNIQLYQNLLKELEYGKGKEVLDRINKTYLPKDINSSTYSKDENVSFPDFYSQEEYDSYLEQHKENNKEEAIVELLGLYTANRLDKVKDGKLISLLKRLLKEMKAFVKQLLGQKEVEIDNLPDNMTLGDIADLLAYSNSKLILPGNEVVYTTPDNQQFKTYAEASKHISNLAKSVEDVDLSNMNLDILKQVDQNDNRLREPSSKDEYDSINAPIIVVRDGDNYIHKKNIGNIEYVDSYAGYFKNTTVFIKEFIEKNKEYEQSKEIIEEWKKVNNIQYNPEEVYSRGQEFISVVGAYSDFDVNLMMQNLLQHIEDNQKAGGEFTISAFTKPIDRIIPHMEGGGGKIKFKIYPKSEDIKWAADTDVFSGSVWDASKKVSKDKKSELLGVSYTKYPGMHNIHSVQPNLASIIDNLEGHHNELGISLTGSNFRLEYDNDIPSSTKKIIDSINSILDQKYGKLNKPEVKESKEKRRKAYSVIYNGVEQMRKDTLEKAKAFVKLHASKWNRDENSYTIQDSYFLEGYDGIQPTQTDKTLKESIHKVALRTLFDENQKEYFVKQGNASYSFGDTMEEALEIAKSDDFFDINEPYIIEEIISQKNEHRLNKEYTHQAITNIKIAKLKEVAKKYPRSLIRSEVKRISNSYSTQAYDNFGADDLIFQKLPSNFNLPLDDSDIHNQVTEFANSESKIIDPISTEISKANIILNTNNITPENTAKFNHQYYTNFPVFKTENNQVTVDEKVVAEYINHLESNDDLYNDSYSLEDTPTEEDPVITKLRLAINNRISTLRAGLTKNTPTAHKINIWNRINELYKDRQALVENRSIESIKEIANRQLTYVANLLDSPTINPAELRLAGNLIEMWQFKFTRALIPQEELDNPNSVSVTIYQQLGNKADLLSNKHYNISLDYAKDVINEQLPKLEVTRKDLTDIKDQGQITTLTLDTSMSNNKIVMAIDDAVKLSQNNQITTKRNILDTITKFFKALREDKAAFAKVGKDYDLFWQTYDLVSLKERIEKLESQIKRDKYPYGENKETTLTQIDILKAQMKVKYTGGFIDRFSDKWVTEENQYKMQLNKIRNDIGLSAEQKKDKIAKIVDAHHAKTIVIDLRFLNVSNIKKPDNPDKYKYRNEREYRAYLAKEWGEELADEFIEEAKERYQRYVEEKANVYEQIDLDTTITNKDSAKADWYGENDPIVAINVAFKDSNFREIGNYPNNRWIKRFPRKIEQGTNKDTGYFDSKFETVIKDKTLHTFFTLYKSMMASGMKMLPDQVRADLPYNFLANVHKSLIEELTGATIGQKVELIGNKMLDSFTTKEIAELNATQERKYSSRKLTGELEKNIPLKYISPVPIEDRTMDLEKMLILFMDVAINYDYKNQVRDKVEVLYSVLEKAAEIEENRKSGKPQLNIDGKEIRLEKEGLKTKQWARFTIDAIMYGERVNKGKPSDKKIFGFDSSLKNYENYDEVVAEIEKFMGSTHKDRLKKYQLAREIEMMRDELERRLEDNELFRYEANEDGSVTVYDYEGEVAMEYTDDNSELNISMAESHIKTRSKAVYEQKMKYLSERYKELGGKSLVYQNLGEMLMKLTQLKGMGLNLAAGIANISFGMVSNIVHANGDKEYGNKQLLQALGIMLKSLGQNPTNNKVFNYLSNLDVLFETVDIRYDAESSESRTRPLRNLDPYIIQNKTEYFVQGVSAIATALKQKVYTKQGEMSVWDLFNDQGKIDKSKFTEEDAIKWNDENIKADEKNEFTKLRAKIIQMNKYLHGNYDPSSPLQAKKVLIGRMLFQFRSWIPMGVVSRFYAERYDPQLDRRIKGRWVTYSDLGFSKSIVTLLKQLSYKKNAFDGLSDVDKENMRKNLAEITMAANLLLLTTLLKSSIEEDDDKKNLYDYTAMLLANQIYRAEQDIYFYMSPMTAYNVLKDPVPITKSISDLLFAMHGTIRYITDDEYRGQPPYVKWAKVFPFTNQLPKLNYLGTTSVRQNTIITNVIENVLDEDDE